MRRGGAGSVKAGDGIGDGAGGSRRAGLAGGRRNGDDQRLDRAGAVVKRREAGAVVGNPKRAGGAEGNAPRIHQVRVSDGGQSRKVGNQVALKVGGPGGDARIQGGKAAKQAVTFTI